MSEYPTYAAYDEQGIWGTGGTPEAALENAVYWVQPDDDPDGPPWILETAPMTDRLAQQVEAQGFDCNHDTFTVSPNGTLDIAPDL